MLMVLSVQTYAEDRTIISIHETTEINKDEIVLGEIGNVIGNDLDLVKKIENTLIGSAPLPGKTKKIYRDHLLICLKKNSIDPSQLDIIIPENAAATRSTIEISTKDIENIVLDFLHKRIPWERDKVKINNIRVKNKVILPQGEITYRVIPPKNTELLGKTPLSVSFSVNGRFKKKIWVSVNIEAFAEVVVTRRPLGRYKLITENDIHLVNMNLTKLPSDIITNCEEVLGKRAKRAINSNVVLRPGLIELPHLVKRGDIVLIIAESDGLKVTTLGRAKEKGRKGQLVKVENIDSAKKIYARVLDSNSVKVDF
jgi:flagella basal body P-ring formation protein FlgA